MTPRGWRERLLAQRPTSAGYDELKAQLGRKLVTNPAGLSSFILSLDVKSRSDLMARINAAYPRLNQRERMDRCLVLNIGVEPYEGEPDQMRWLEMKPKGSSRRTVIFRPIIRSPGERTIH
jgi:hypothetical protein